MTVAAKKGGNLVLKRKPGQGITFTHAGIDFTVIIEKGDLVIINAPPEVRVRRSELPPQEETE